MTGLFQKPWLAVAAAFACLLSSCRVAPQRAPAEAPLPPCAILVSESNIRFTREQPFSGGPAAYTNLVLGLQAALATKGVTAHLVSEDDVERNRLCNYAVLFVTETFSIDSKPEKAIRYFVEHGGVLVGINEVGRFQGEWTRPWHYQDVFGVRATNVDMYGSALSWAGGLFQYADVTPEGRADPLIRGLGEPLDLGSAASNLWVTKPAGATVLATFPAYVRSAPEPPELVGVVSDAVVAVSINDFGQGKAVWIASRVHERDPANWTRAGATLDLLARCAELGRGVRLPLPVPPPRTYLGISQVGYAPDEVKGAIIRVAGEETPPFDRGTWELRDAAGDVVRSGGLAPEGPAPPWGDVYYTADFSDLAGDGAYRFSASLHGDGGSLAVTGGEFRIGRSLWTSAVVPTQYSFLYDYRCGEKCHTNDPVRGGYHDATGDYGVRMWSMPHVAYGIAENILATPQLPSGEKVTPVEELKWSVRWLLAMQDADGRVGNSVVPTNEWSRTDLRPADEPGTRRLEKGDVLNYETTYIAGMAHAAMALRNRDPELSVKALEAARRTHAHILGRPWRTEASGEIGNFIWGCVELARATGETGYLERAKALAPILLQRQFTETDKAEGGLRGDFLETAGGRHFGNKQYKKFHTIGLYLGLVELAPALPAADPLRADIAGALDLYFNEHLLRGAELTPYGQMITALEPDGRGRFRIWFFTHPEDWVRLHGLNCDHLALGYTALKYAALTGRQDLRDFARAQAQWVVGANPLGICMVDFLGWANPPVIDESVGTGRFPGGIPNGIVGDAQDRPKWGETWDSREYWLPHNAYLLAIAPHLDKQD